MFTQSRVRITTFVGALILTLGFAFFAYASGNTHTVTITNISNTVITPPILAFTNRNAAPFFTLGESASVPLEELAEGGDTTSLKEYYEDMGARVTTHDAAIAPGESIEIEVSSFRRGVLHFGAMLLPTNDAFVALNGVNVPRRGSETFYANAYDAGTESNSEMCSDIPGPCGGEGFNSERDDLDIIIPHAGIHGEAEISRKDHNWTDPVVKIEIERN